MSHFSVMVIGPNVDAQLAPYHEFECTGHDDQYVVHVDRTEEARHSYATSTTTRLRSPTGVLHSYFNPEGEWRSEFSELEPEAPTWDKNRRRRKIPEGWTEVEIPKREVMSFKEFIECEYGFKPLAHGEQPDLKEEHKYGHVLLDANGEAIAAIDRTNPNKKWDWYSIGGRWQGFLHLKQGAAGIELGEPGAFGPHDDTDPLRHTSQCLKRDIDFNSMREKSGAKAAELWEKAHRITDGAAWRSWEEIVKESKEDYKLARETYWAQGPVNALRETRDPEFVFDIDDSLAGPKDAFIAAARDRAISTFALVMDGRWTAKGEMGWFGCSTEETPHAEWNRRMNELLDSLPDDTLITIVDCHI